MLNCIFFSLLNWNPKNTDFFCLFFIWKLLQVDKLNPSFPTLTKAQVSVSSTEVSCITWKHSVNVAGPWCKHFFVISFFLFSTSNQNCSKHVHSREAKKLWSHPTPKTRLFLTIPEQSQNMWLWFAFTVPEPLQQDACLSSGCLIAGLMKILTKGFNDFWCL